MNIDDCMGRRERREREKEGGREVCREGRQEEKEGKIESVRRREQTQVVRQYKVTSSL